MRRAYDAGVRTEVLHASLVGNRMMLVSRLRVPERLDCGPVDGQIMYRACTLCDGRIVPIEDSADMTEAVVMLLETRTR